MIAIAPRGSVSRVYKQQKMRIYDDALNIWTYL